MTERWIDLPTAAQITDKAPSMIVQAAKDGKLNHRPRPAGVLEVHEGEVRQLFESAGEQKGKDQEVGPVNTATTRVRPFPGSL